MSMWGWDAGLVVNPVYTTTVDAVFTDCACVHRRRARAARHRFRPCSRDLVRRHTCSTYQKVVVFYDSEQDASLELLDTVESIAGRWQSMVRFYKCGRHLPINQAEIANAGFTNFPYIFTTFPVIGIEQYPSEMPRTAEAIDAWLEYKTNPVLPSNIVRFVDEDQFYDTLDTDDDTVALVKFYEEWCSHCQALKRPFEKLAGLYADTNVVFVEVECSASSESTAFCSKHSVTAYPVVKLFTGEDVILLEGNRDAFNLEALLLRHAGVAQRSNLIGHTVLRGSPVPSKKPASHSSGSVSKSASSGKKDKVKVSEVIKSMRARLDELEHKVETLETAMDQCNCLPNF